MTRCSELFWQFLFAVLIGDFYSVSSLENWFEVSRHPGWNLGLAYNDDFITLLADYHSVVLANCQGLDLLTQRKNRLRWPLIFITWRVSAQGHILPEHQSTFPGASHKRSSSSIINYWWYLVSCHIGVDTVGVENIEDSQVVIFIRLQVPESDHIFIGTSWKETLAYPNRGQVLRLTWDWQFHFFLGYRFLCEVYLELNQEQVGCDHDGWTFLLIEHKSLYRSTHSADIWAHVHIVCQTNCSWPSREEEKVAKTCLDTLNVEVTENTVSDSPLFLVDG